MNPWHALYEQHSSLRRQASLADELKEPLKRLAAMKNEYCDPSLPWFLKTKTDNAGRYVLFMKSSNEQPGPVSLKNLPDLTDARLSVQATIAKKGGPIQEFSAAISGTTDKKVSWTVAIHLTSSHGDAAEPGWAVDWQGTGACSHAVYHCHVGPDLDAKPKVRVPFPAVPPGHALDWLLATVVPGYEPLPWKDLAKLVATTAG